MKKRYTLPIALKYVVIALGAVCLILILKAYLISLVKSNRYFIPSINVAGPFVNYLTWIFMIRLIYRNIETNPLSKHGLVSLLKHVGIAFLIIFLHVIISNILFYSYFYTTGMCPLSQIPTSPDPWNEILFPFFRMLISDLPGDILSRSIEYAIISGGLIAIGINQEYHRKKLELANMEKERNLAQLKALQMQLRPHFMFNALNSVSSLMESDVKEAQSVLALFGKLLRKTLHSVSDTIITLSEELEYIKSYLEIERIRFHDRLKIVYDIDDDTLTCKVPCMILQPLVENAMKHGFSKSLKKCTIRIAAKRTKEGLSLSIEDNGIGTSDVSAILENPGIGISNTLARLKTLYPDRYSVEVISNLNDGLSFTIVIPCEQ